MDGQRKFEFREFLASIESILTFDEFSILAFQLEPYMTENLIIAAFHKMGENPQTVRIMRNKYTGEPAGYCFVNFMSDDQSIDAMHKLNGKPIPGTNPIVRFRLNSASNSNKLPGSEREYSIWVGDLSSDVDDYNLYRVFSNKYSSIKTAKVILDSSGFSKGYGFVRFGMEEEQKSALYEMNGYVGLGLKPLKICNAVPKPKSSTGAGKCVCVCNVQWTIYSFRYWFSIQIHLVRVQVRHSERPQQQQQQQRPPTIHNITIHPLIGRHRPVDMDQQLLQ